MKLMLLLSAFLATALVLAYPVDEHTSVEVVIVTVTTYITGSGPTETETTSPTTSPTSAKTHDPPAESTKGSKNNNNHNSFDYAKAMLDAHNSHRYNHSAPELSWSDELAGIAKKIGHTCNYNHSMDVDGGGYGQNIGAGAPPEDGPAMITNLMYNGEIGLYPGYGSEPSMENFERWGHFSQLVWKGTRQVGCATIHCPDGLANTGQHVSPYFLVCNFKPSGESRRSYQR